MKAVLALCFLMVLAIANAQGMEEYIRRYYRYNNEDLSSSSCTIQASALNVRSSPGGGILFQVYRGQRVSRVGSQSYRSGNYNWIQISANGRQGYVANSSSFISCSSGSTGGSSYTGGSSSSSGRCPNSTKVRDSLKMVHQSEGKCQNWRNDSGNWMNGKLGYTCAGIIPKVGYGSRSMFPYVGSRCNHVASEMWVKCAWDLSNSQFKEGADRIYERDYGRTGGCSNMAQPAYYVCLDIAINSGPGRSKQFIRELGAYTPNDPKGYATKLNERHRRFYIAISQPGSKNARFRNGWLARADRRKRYIDGC